MSTPSATDASMPHPVPDAPLASLIRARRTVRRFAPDPVDEQMLRSLLETACWSPNHGLREPWRFILYKDQARERFIDAVIQTLSAEDRSKYGETRSSYLREIPLHLLVISPEDPRQKQRDEDYGAACAWIQSFQLAAWEQGIGVVWKTNPYIYAPAFRQAVGIAPGERVVGVLHIGYPLEVPPARPRTPLDQLLTIASEA